MNSPTPFDPYFDALEAALRIPCPREAHADGAGSQETRIVWVPGGGGPKPEAIPYQRSREKVIGRVAHPWTATVYGPTYLDVSNLLGALWAETDILLGPPKGSPEMGNVGDDDYAPEQPGYVFAPGKIEPQGDDAAASIWACEVAVTLYQPVASRKRGTAEGKARLEIKPAMPDSLAEPTEVVWPS